MFLTFFSRYIGKSCYFGTCILQSFRFVRSLFFPPESTSTIVVNPFFYLLNNDFFPVKYKVIFIHLVYASFFSKAIDVVALFDVTVRVFSECIYRN